VVSHQSESMSFLESAAMAAARRAPATLPSIEQLTLRSVHRAGLPRSSCHLRTLSIIAPSTRCRRSPAQLRVSRTTIRSYIKLAESAPKHAQEPMLAPKPARGTSKVFKNADEAVADIKSGSTVLSAGFGLCGTAGENWPNPSNHNLH
jgi:3-oxoacid CoA-transferase